MEMNYRVSQFYHIINEMVDVICAHESKTRGKEFTVKDLIAELDAADPPKPSAKSQRTQKKAAARTAK